MSKTSSKKLLKGLSVLMSCVVLSVSFSGCKGSENESGKTKITVGGWPTDEKELEKKEAARVAFEEDNPDVIIEGDTWKFDLKTFYPKAEAGMLPTLFSTAFTEVTKVLDNGYAADITKQMDKYGYSDKLNPIISELVSRDGKICGLPAFPYVLGLMYNVKLFEAAGLMEEDGTPKQPRDWDELAEFAAKIKQATGKAGFVFPTSNNNGGWIFTCFAWSYGVDFMKQSSDGKWKATFDSSEAAEALQFIKDLKWKYNVLPSNTLIDANEQAKLYATGNAGMYIASGDSARSYGSYDMDINDIGVMALPAGPKGRFALLGGSVNYVAEGATEKQKDAAVRWLRGEVDYEANERYKLRKKDALETIASKGGMIGVYSFPLWSTDAGQVKFDRELIDGMCKVNKNHFRLYNEYIDSPDLKVRVEEPISAQDLYAVLDNCIQEVLTNKNADCAALLKKANDDFQHNYLDILEN